MFLTGSAKICIYVINVENGKIGFFKIKLMRFVKNRKINENLLSLLCQVVSRIIFF